MYHLLLSFLLPLPCMDCPAPPPKPTAWGKPCRWGKNPAHQQKKCSFPTPEKSHSPNSNFHVITQYKLIYSFSHCCWIICFLASTFIYWYIMLILISWGLPAAWQKYWMVKIPLSEIPNPPWLFNAIWKTLFQLLLVFLFTPSMFISNFINFFWLHSSCDYIAYKLTNYNLFQIIENKQDETFYVML